MDKGAPERHKAGLLVKKRVSWVAGRKLWLRGWGGGAGLRGGYHQSASVERLQGHELEELGMNNEQSI